eukprot:scaffold155_cov347-Pavlova_lutheri.AAC.45
MGRVAETKACGAYVMVGTYEGNLDMHNVHSIPERDALMRVHNVCMKQLTPKACDTPIATHFMKQRQTSRLRST